MEKTLTLQQIFVFAHEKCYLFLFLMLFLMSADTTLLAEGQWSFDYPLFIVLNQSVGAGGYDYFMPQTDKVYETQFDWVRVYQRRP